MATIFALLLALPAVGNAQGRNNYGAKGRTIISGGVGGFTSTAEMTDHFGHDATWSSGMHLTLAHFWIDNIAVGGTFLGGKSHVERGPNGEENRSWLGGDVDVIGHLPLNPRLSVRLWLWGGLRWRQSESRQETLPEDVVGVVDGSLVSVDIEPEVRTTRALSLATGADLGLLVHLSPSVALTLGPNVTVYRKLSGAATSDYVLSAGPSMSYSFGPRDGQDPSPLDDARTFGKRGRRVLQLYGVFNEDKVLSGVTFARFVADHFAVGGYASGGLDGRDVGRNFVGGGVVAMADLPIGTSISVLATPRLGYMLTRVREWTPYVPEVVDQERRWAAVHQLQAALPVYLALHLYDGLVLGLGPELAYDRRLPSSSTSSWTNETYLQIGLGSTILGSF